VKQNLQLTKLPVPDSINSFPILNSKLHFKSVSFRSLCSALEELMKKFNSLYGYYKICLSLPYSLISFFLEETPKALCFPYIAYCSLCSKFWKAWTRLSAWASNFKRTVF